VCHAAGVRNAVFDSVFFSSEHTLRNKLDAPPAASYAIAAAAALSLDFPIDVAVKRAMAAPADAPVRGGVLRATFNLVRERRLLVFTGLSAKVCEFATSYGVTGWASTHVNKVLT